MKKLLLFPSILLISALICVTVSCSDDDKGDTTRPTAELIEPAQGSVLKIGAAVNLVLHLSDNDGLSSYRVNIHSAKGHTHEETKAAAGDQNDGEEIVIFDKSWNLAGTKDTTINHQEIIIEDNIEPGDYHFMVYCTDKSGNEAEYQINTVDIEE